MQAMFSYTQYTYILPPVKFEGEPEVKMRNETRSDSRVRFRWRLHIFVRVDVGSVGKPRLEASGGNVAGDLCENPTGNWFHRIPTQLGRIM